MSCLIDKGVVFDCESPQQGGIINRLIFINKADWDEATIVIDTGSTEEITSITLASGGKQGYEFAVPKSSYIILGSPYRGIDGIDGFDHTIDVRVSSIEQLDRINIAKMRFVKVVVIAELIEGRSLVYGQEVGLRMSDFQESPGDASTGGTMQFIVKTPDVDPPEINLPQIIASSFDIDDLLTPTI